MPPKVALVNYVSKYRALLKLLRRAAFERPHHLQETRFLLGRPLVVSFGTERQDFEGGDTDSAQGVATPHAGQTLTPENYMYAPANRIHRIDRGLLYRICAIDLRHSLETTDASNATPSHVLQRQVLYSQQLKWLEEWLARIVGPETTAFMRDDFVVASPADVFADDNNAEEDAALSSTATAKRVVSAGAREAQMEPMIYRAEIHNFPFCVEFLEDFQWIDKPALRACVNDHKHLVSLVTSDARAPPTVVCRNNDIKLTVTATRFDSEYTDMSEAGAGFFARAHQIFALHFHITALNTEYTTHICNTHVCALDVQERSVYIDVGRIDGQDLACEGRRRLQQVALSSGGPTQTPSDDGDGDRSDDSDLEASLNLTNTRAVKLCYSSPAADDNAVLLKGLVYYRVGTPHMVLHTPIRVIAFSDLLLDPCHPNTEA